MEIALVSGQRKGEKGCVRRYVYILLVLMLGGLLWAGWYGYEKGFTRKWRSFVTEEFRKRGVELSLRQLALEPFRGMVARDVKVYDGRGRKRTLAVVNEVVLVINYANFFQNKPFIEALDLREARLSLPLEPKDPRGPAVEINNLSGRLLLPPQQIHLNRLEADLYGVHLSASGLLINPQAFQSAKGGAGQRSLGVIGERIIEELKALKFEGAAPQLQLRFSGDLADADKIFIEGTLSADKVRQAGKSGWRLERVRAAAAYRDGIVDLQQVSAADGQGALEAHGHWRVNSKQMDLRLRSTLDGQSLIGLLGLGAPWSDCGFDAAPLVELTLEGAVGEMSSMRVVSRVRTERFSYKGTTFEKSAADFSWQDGNWSARDVELTHRSGKLQADVLAVPGGFRARVESRMQPSVLLPWVPASFGGLFAQFNFVDTPRIQFEVTGGEPDMAACTIDGVLEVSRASYRNGPVEALKAGIQWRAGRWTVEPRSAREAAMPRR